MQGSILETIVRDFNAIRNTFLAMSDAASNFYKKLRKIYELQYVTKPEWPATQKRDNCKILMPPPFPTY